MKKAKMITIGFAVAFLVMSLQEMITFASEDVMEPYEEKLDQINQELGTNFKFNNEGELSKTEMEQFYTSMSVDEFDVYMRNAIEKAQNMSNCLGEDARNDWNIDSGIQLMELTTEQRYIYDTAHYLYVSVNINTEHGVTTYTAFHGAGDSGSQGSYPFYRVDSYVASLSENSKILSCNFSCFKCIAPNVSNTYATPILVNFKAGGGNVYPSA